MTSLNWLQNWCIDNLPEKSLNLPSVIIDNLDNPGWTIEIHLAGTAFEKRKFVPIKIDHTEHDWFYCRIENNVFHGSGGTRNLENLLGTFGSWVSENELIAPGILGWMQQWYLNHCDEYWEEYYGFRIERTDASEWSVNIDIVETELESRTFIEQKEKKDNTNWYRCWVSEGKFFGKGGPRNLVNILEAFRKWAITS